VWLDRSWAKHVGSDLSIRPAYELDELHQMGAKIIECYVQMVLR